MSMKRQRRRSHARRMTDEHSTLRDAATRLAWSPDQQLAVLLTYIGRQQSPEAFRDFLAEVVESEENGPRAARDVPAGQSWAFHHHRSQAQV